MDIDLAMTRDADDDLEQAARHRCDAKDRKSIRQIGLSNGSVDAQSIERMANALRFRCAEPGDECAPHVGLPALMLREVVAVNGDIATLGPTGEHRRSIHLITIEEVGDAAGPHRVIDPLIEQHRSDRPGQLIDRPGMVIAVAEGAGSERSGEGELDIGADTEPLGEPMGEPTADRGTGDHDDFGGEGVIEGFAKAVGETIDEVIEPLANPQPNSHRSDSTHGV